MFISLTLLFLGLGILSLGGGLLCSGINDGEWGRIHETGKFSHPDTVDWSSWETDTGTVRADFLRDTPPKPALAEFRKGVARGAVFDFTLYEIRAKAWGAKVYPAIGPDWGAHYHWGWSAAFFAVTGLCFLLWLYFPLPRNP
jgi:hypothetical protein